MPRHKANGEGSIVQLPNGKYKGTMTAEVIYNPDNTVNKQIRKTFTHEKKKAVQRWMTEQLDLKNKDKLVTPNKLTVAQWLAVWLEKYKKNSVKPRTYEGYETIINQYLKPNIGKYPLQTLKTSQIQDVLNKLIETGKSPRTAEYTYVTIHAALKQAEKEGYVFKNVSENCTKPKKEKKELDILTKKEITNLLEANKEHRLYPLLLLELGTGLRASEILALHWNNIDLDNGLLYVEGNIVNTKEGIQYQNMPKTKSSRREIPLPAEVVDELKSYKERESAKDTDIVFKNKKGAYTNPSTLTHLFYYWLSEAKIRRRSFHSLRHTHATQLLALDVHAKIVQARLGHSSINVTLDIYTHALPHMQQEAADKINGLLTPLTTN